MSRFVTRDRVEQVRRSVIANGKISRSGSAAASAASAAAAAALRSPRSRCAIPSEQMRFNERERGAGRGRDVRNVSKYVQRTGGISLRDADHCARVVNETHPIGFGGESG